MAWYNNFGDFVGDIGSIAHGKNPSNQAPPVNIPASGGVGTPTIPGLPNSGQKISTNSDDPSDASSGYWDDPNSPMGGSSGGSSFDMGGLVDAIKKGGSAIVDYITAHPDQVLSLVNAYNSYQRQGKSDNFANQGLALATSEYNDPTGKAALRTAGTAGMLNPRANTPGLSSLQTLAGSGSGNPFTKALPLAPLNHPPTTSTTPGSTPGSAPGGWKDGIGQVVNKTVPPAALPLAGAPNTPLPPPGQQTGTPPTIPVGMKPPVGWMPPKALPLATDPNAPKVI